MKIVVDKLPQFSDQCPFHLNSTKFTKIMCKITDQMIVIDNVEDHGFCECSLNNSNRCCRLISIREAMSEVLSND